MDRSTDFTGLNASRRQFVFVLAAAPTARLAFAPGEAERRIIEAARLTFAQGRAKRSVEAELRTIVERRVYDRSGVIPPESVLRRCGMHSFTRRDEPGRVTFLIRFTSPAERARAWDRFNTDAEWCRLRESGPVRLEEISITA